MNQRLGIFGGTYDPVHLGHIHAAREISVELELDQLNLVPAFLPVHRGTPSATSAQRLAMLKLAIHNQPGLGVDDREINRQGPSYSLLTLKEYRALYPEACLYFILGTDAVSQFHTWYRWQEFLEYVNLVVLSRPGSQLHLTAELEQAFADSWQTELEAFKSSQAGQIYVSERAMLTQSATEVRQAIAEEDSAQQMLAENVYEYIREHKLYSQDLIE